MTPPPSFFSLQGQTTFIPARLFFSLLVEKAGNNTGLCADCRDVSTGLDGTPAAVNRGVTFRQRGKLLSPASTLSLFFSPY
jgi:hypothetical protein